MRSLPAGIKERQQIVAGLLTVILLFGAPVSANAFSLDTAGNNILRFILFCLIIIVAASAGMSLAKSNVVGAVIIVIVGGIIYGVLDPTAFKDIAEGIKTWLGIGSGGGTS